MSRLMTIFTATVLALSPAALAGTSAAAATSSDIAWVATWDDPGGEGQVDAPVNSVQKVNLATGEILDRVEFHYTRPAEIALSKPSGNLWVLSQPWNYDFSSIAIVDTTAGTATEDVFDTAYPFPGDDHDDQYSIVSDFIGDIQTSLDGSLIFVSGEDVYSNAGAVLVFDAATEEFVGAVPLAYTEPHSFALNSLENVLYVTTNDGSDTFIETIDLSAADWATAATDLSEAVEWPNDVSCYGQAPIDYDTNSNSIFATCWDASGFTVYDLDTQEFHTTEITFDQTSTIGIDVSDDGTRIALGTCYDGSVWAELNSDFSVSNVRHDPINTNDTGKPVRFFGDGDRYAAGTWLGRILTFTPDFTNGTEYELLGTDADPDNIGNIYVAAIELTDPFLPTELADTGFDAYPALAGGLLAAAIGAVAMRRRSRS